MGAKRVLILHAPGTNRDGDLAEAFRVVGATPEIVSLAVLKESLPDWRRYHLMALPGGFSYGDALGAGRLWALDLQTWFHEFVSAFVASGRPVIGICNGFQALVKAGILPGSGASATLTFNASGHFECRWVRMRPNPGNSSPWLKGLETIDCPVAHGEGRFLLAEETAGRFAKTQVAFQYTGETGRLAGGAYPENPNGSPNDIAGVTNAAGNVLGLMPHPEDHIHPYQYLRWTRRNKGAPGTPLFANGLSI